MIEKTSIRSSIDLGSELTGLDLLVFGLVLLLTLASVVYGVRRKSDPEKNSFIDFLLMGRQLTLPLFVMTLVATWYGGIFGVTRISFEKGIYNFITQGVFWYGSYIVFALFLVNKIRKFESITLADMTGSLYGIKSRKLTAVFNFINVVPVVYTISLGILIRSVTDLTLFEGSALGLLFVCLYSAVGGFRAVVFSDVVQFFVMCLSVLMVFVISILSFGGIDFLKENLPPDHFSPTGGESILTLFVWGLIAFSTLVDPNFYQRCFAANSEKTAKKGILISTVIWACFDICTTAGGLYARALIPEANPEDAYLTYSIQVLPSGLRGLFLAGILATILSTIDSYLFIGSTTFVHDLLGKKDEKKSRLLHHFGVFMVAGISLLLAMVFEGNIKNVWKTLGSYSASCLLIPVIWGLIFKKKISDLQFVMVCLGGVISTTFWMHAPLISILGEIDEIYIGSLTTGFLMLVMTVINQKKARI